MADKERITDLEKFVYEHIRMPYKNHKSGIDADAIRLHNVYHYKQFYPEWWELVSNRIKSIGFRFPPYVQHPLVDIINEVCE